MTDIALDFSGEIKSVTDLALAFGALKIAATATDNVDLKNFRGAFKTLGTASTAALREVLNGVKSSLDELTKAVNAHKITSVVDQAAVQTGLDTLLKTASSAQHQLTLISVEENAKRRTDEATTAQKILQMAKDVAEAQVAEEKSKGAKLIAEAVKLRAEKKAIGDQELNEIKAHYEKVKAMDVNDANARFQAMSLEAQKLRVLRVESLLAANVAPSAVVKRYGSDATIAALQSESFTRSAVIKEGTAAEVAARLERIRAVGAASQTMLEQRKLNNASLLAVIRDQEATDKMQIAEMRANTAAEAAAILERNTAIKASVAAAMNSATGVYQKYNPNTGLAGGLVNMPVNPIHPKALPDTNALIDATKSLTGHHRILNDGVRGLVQSLGMYSATVTSIIPMMAGMALGMAAIKPLKVGAEFEQSMFVIHEVAGTSTADMVKVKDAVLDIGKSTQYGPLEVAKGLETLTLAGLATVDALQAIKPVLHFAAAGAVPLEAAAETLVAVATAYKYSAQNIEAVGDIIAKTAADTMASVTDMSAAFKMSTIVAQQYGMSLNDTAMALGMLAQIGIRGTMAGTSYRNMLTEFNKGSGKAADGIKLLGVELKNADGSAKDLMTSMESLSKGLITKNPVSQGRLLDDIANERGGKSLAAFQAAFNVELNKSNPLLQQEVNLLLASGKAAEAKKVAEEAVTATYARMREAVQKSIDSTAAYTFLVNLEEQFTTLGTYKGLLASLQTDFVKAFDTASDSTKLLTLSLRETFNTPEFTQAVAILANAVLDVVTALAKLAAFTTDSPVASVAGLTAAFLTCKLAVAGLGIAVAAIPAAVAAGMELLTGTAAAIAVAFEVGFGVAVAATVGLAAAVAAVVAGIGYLIYAVTDSHTAVEKTEAAKREEYIKTHNTIVDLSEKVLASQQGQIDIELSRVAVLNEVWVENRRLTAMADAAEWQSITALGGKTSEEGKKYHAQAEALRAQRVTASQAEAKVAGEAMIARINMWEETKLQIIEATKLQRIFNAETFLGGLLNDKGAAISTAQREAEADTKATKTFAENARTRARTSAEALVAAKAAQQAYAALDAAAAKVKPYGEGVGGYAGKPKFAFPTEAERAAKQEAKKDAKDAAEALEFYNSVLNKSSGYLKTYAEDQNKLALVYEKGWATYEEYAKAVAEYMKTQPFMLKAIKDEEAATKARVEATVKSINAELDAYYKSRDAIDEVEKSLNALAHTNAEYTESLEFEQSLLGLGAKERETAIEQYKIIAKYKAEATSIEAKTSDPVVRAAQLASNAIQQAQAISNTVRAKQLTDWNTTFDSISSGLTDAIMNAGKDGGKGLRDYLEAELLTKPFKMVIQAMVQPYAQSLTNFVMGSGGGGSAGGAAAADVSNIFSTAGNASSIGSMFASAFPAAATTMSTVGSAALAGIQSMVGMTGTAAQAATAAANGIAYATTGAASTAASAGSMIAAAGPYVAAAMAIYAIHQATQGETRVGGEYRSNITDGAKYAYGPSGGDFAASQVKLAINTTTEAINATLKQVGSAVTLTAFAAGYETSDRDRGGAYAGGTLSSGASFGQDGSGDNYAGTKYDPTKGFNHDAQGAVAALDIELKQAIIETLQAAGDIPQAVTKVIDNALAKANVDSVAKLSAEATDATMSALNTVIGSVEAFNTIVTTLPFKALADLSFDTAASLIEFAGGIDNLASNLGGFYTNFYKESDQLALKTEFASKAFAELGVVMPAIDATTRDWYRSLIDTQLGLDQGNEATAKTTAGLLALQSAVNELAPVAEVIKSAISGTAEAIENQANWQGKLEVALGLTTSREIEKAAALKAADDATDNLINSLYALEDAAALESRKKTLVDKYAPLTLEGAKAALPEGFANAFAEMGLEAAKEWVSSYVSELSTPGDVKQVEDLSVALDTLFAGMEASEARLKGLSDEAAQLSIELLTAQGDTIGAANALRDLETQGFNAVEVAAYDYNRALREQITTANSAKAALDSLTSTMRSIRDSKDVIAGVNQSPTEKATISLADAVEDFNTAASIITKEVPLISTATTKKSFFDAFPDALAALKATPVDALNAWVDAYHPELKGKSFETPEWANAIFDWAKEGREADTTGTNKTGVNWLDPDEFGNVMVTAIVNGFTKVQVTDPDYVNKTAEEIQAIDPATLDAKMQGLLTTVFGASANVTTATTAEVKKVTDVSDTLIKEGKGLNVELLNLQGKFTEAKAAAKTLATEGMEPENVLLWEANELVRTQIATLTEHNTLQDELNGLRDTEAEALTRQRNALDESNRALFDQVQGFKTLKSLQEQFTVPLTADTASSTVSAAGYNVTGMDTAGIASYITGILNAPGMLTASGDLTAAGLATVATLNGLTDSLKILGTEGDKAADQLKTNAATQKGLNEQISVLNGTRTKTEVDRANVLESLTKAGDTASIALQNTVWGLEDLATAAQVTQDYNRAMLDAAGNSAGLEAFDKAISDAALITAGWTQAQVDAVNTTKAATKLTATNKDWTTQLDVLTGKSTQQQIDRQIQLAGVTEKTTLALMNQVFAQQDLNAIADERKALESELLSVQGDTAALRKIELAGIDASNRSLKLRIWALQDEKEAQDRYTKAVSARDSAQSTVDSIRESATSNYLSAQEKVASAQQRIADITASALKETAQKAFDAATKMRELGKSLREFVSGETLTPNQNFASTLQKALEGDQDAMANLSGAATEASTVAAERAGNVALAQARIMASVMQAATLAEATALPTVPADADPMTAATAELATAQTELADALRVANAIGASTTRSADDLIGKFTTAQTTLAEAIAELATAAAALDAIKANTAATATATDSTATNTTGIVPAVTGLEASLSAIQLTANATIDFIVGSTLPDDLKDLALGGARQIDATVSFFQGAELAPDVLKLATAAATDLYHTVNFVVGSTLPDDLKTLALTNVSTLAKTVDLIVGSAIPDDVKALALGTTSDYITTVTAVLASNTSDTLKNLVLTGVGDYEAMVKAAADPAMPSALRSVIFDGAGQYISTISAITSSTMSDAQKTLLLNANSAASRIVTIGAALSGTMTAEQQAILNASQITITKTLNTLVTGGSFTAAQLDILNAATGSVTKTLNTVATGSLTADQLAVYNATTQSVTKTFNATATGAMTQDQKDILGIVTGATNGSVVISGTATFEPSTAHKELLKQQAQGLLLILQELKTQGTKNSFTVLTFAEQISAAAGLKAALGYPSAQGNIFSGGLVPFASGGQFSNSVISDPTYFDMGLMGEAGPEAIMPLKRMPNGDLGVQITDFSRYGRDSGNDALVAEIRALREEVAELRKSNSNENQAIATHTANTADSTRRMDTQGVLVYTDPAEPLLTEVAP